MNSRTISILGTHFNVPHFDESQSNVWNDINQNIWEPQTFLIIDKMVKSNSNVLEVGVDSCQTLLFTAEKSSKTIAIEPSSKSIEYAKLLLSMNPRISKKVNLIHGALHKENSDIIFGSSSKFFDSIHFINNDLQELVHGYKIEDIAKLFQGPIDFINLDIEGGEYLLLPSMLNYLKKFHPTLLLSMHPGFNMKNRGIFRFKIVKLIFRIYRQISVYRCARIYSHVYDLNNNIEISAFQLFKLNFLTSSAGKNNQILLTHK